MTFLRLITFFNIPKSKIILVGSFIITLVGMVLLFFSEFHNTLVHINPFEAFISLFFNSVSFRSAGFTLAPIGNYTIATIMVMMLFGFIGSAPGSTGSGIKVTSFIIAIASIRNIMSGHSRVQLSGRTIATDQVIKAFSIIALSVFWIFLGTFLLAITDPGHSFLEIVLEVSSAFTNLGISAGITEKLSVCGKWLILTSMLVGRVGSLAFILAWAKRTLIRSKRPYSYPEERIMLE